MNVLAKLVALFVLLGSTVALSGTAFAADRDCADFGTQKQAQIFFLQQGGPQSDPHRLDADGDGIACETLPCPCYYEKDLPDDGTDPEPKPKPKKTTIRQKARIIKVVDGDTVRVRLKSGKRHDVRLIGIDTPEVYGGTQCWGPEASKWMKKQLPKKTWVLLVSDTTQAKSDRYGRLLRYVIRAKDGRDMNRAQVWAGNAKVYVYNSKPFKRTKSYRTAQSQAKKADRGLWGNC